MMERSYETVGSLFFVPTMTGRKGLIAMDFDDYDGLLVAGMMNEEVDVRIIKAEWGVEYQESPPECSIRGGLYPIEMDATKPKPQIDFEEKYVDELLERGFHDMDKVNLRIESLPYHNYRESEYDDLKLGLDI